MNIASGHIICWMQKAKSPAFKRGSDRECHEEIGIESSCAEYYGENEGVMKKIIRHTTVSGVVF